MDRYLDLQLFAKPEEEVEGALDTIKGVEGIPEVNLDITPPTPEPVKEVIQESAEGEQPPNEPLANDPTQKQDDADESTPYGEPTTAQLNKINKFSKRKLTKEEVFVTHARFVGDGLLKDRAVKLDESLLRLYMKNAKSGVAFMLDHPWAGFFAKPKAALSYGRTFDAALTPSTGNSEAPDEKFVLEGWIYIVRGKEKDGISTDEIIKDIEDGTLFDGSIGFYFETAECSICHESIWECKHWPGEEYEVDGKMQFCYIIAKPPGGLMEYSGVFDGAYPGAGFSADGESESACVEVKNIKEVSKGTALRFVYSSQHGLRAYRKNEPVKESRDPAKSVIDEERAKEIAGANWQSQILDMADEGRVLKADLIEDALSCGVKAMGNSFDRDLYKALFEKSTVDEIKRYRSQFMDKAKEEIPSQRQVTPPTLSKSATPPMAFRIRKE